MNLDDLIKLAGVAKSQADTPVQEQPDATEGMRTMIALVTPEQLNQLTGDVPVAEEMPGEATTEPDPQPYEGPLGSPADLSLRRYLGANGQPVHVDETKVYEDHKVEDITEAWRAYKAEPVAETVVDEDDVEEDNAFNSAAANAKKAGKSHFTFNGKKYPVKIDDKTADALTDDIDRIKNLAGLQVDEAPFPGEYDYTDSKYMDADGTPKSGPDMSNPEVGHVMAVMKKYPEEVAKMKATGDMDTMGNLYQALVSMYSDEMPYGTMKARDGDPVEWIMNKLDDLDLLENDAQKVDEAPSPGEYDYSDDKYDADGAVTGVGKQGTDMRFAKWSEDTPSEVMMVIKKYDLDPMDAYQMATADVNADIDAIADLHDDFIDRTGSDSDIDSGEEFLASPEYAKVMTMVGDLCSAMGMEGAGREECGQALMKHVDENAPKESAEINDLRKLAGI